jgi:hypothetical protein
VADIITCCLGSLEEEIYNVFRPYGVIDDLVINGDATALAAAGLAGGGMQLVMLPVFKLSSHVLPRTYCVTKAPSTLGAAPMWHWQAPSSTGLCTRLWLPSCASAGPSFQEVRLSSCSLREHCMG